MMLLDLRTAAYVGGSPFIVAAAVWRMLQQAAATCSALVRAWLAVVREAWQHYVAVREYNDQLDQMLHRMRHG